MLVHCKVTPSIKFAGTHLYTRVERGTVSSVLPKDTMQCPRPGLKRGLLDSRDECTNHEATAPPTFNMTASKTWYIERYVPK